MKGSCHCVLDPNSAQVSSRRADATPKVRCRHPSSLSRTMAVALISVSRSTSSAEGCNVRGRRWSGIRASRNTGGSQYHTSFRAPSTIHTCKTSNPFSQACPFYPVSLAFVIVIRSALKLRPSEQFKPPIHYLQLVYPPK